jgi:hypothetical protein
MDSLWPRSLSSHVHRPMNSFDRLMWQPSRDVGYCMFKLNLSTIQLTFACPCRCVVQVFVARHRLKFLQLSDVFLASSLVPAYTAAAFIKRFARIALTAPPMGAITCIAFIHNLLRRHPSCTCMVHQPPSPDAQGNGQAVGASAALGQDIYDAEAEDPAASRAIESSLWELKVLRHHQIPAVRPSAVWTRAPLVR